MKKAKSSEEFLKELKKTDFTLLKQLPILKDKLILLKRKNPTVYEIHRWEIQQTKNLIFTTSDLEFAKRLVNNYNKL